MTRIAILGSTGSIGTQTLDVVRAHPDRLEVVGLASGSNSRALLAQASEFPRARLALFDQQAAAQSGLPGGIEAICEVAADQHVDLVVVATAGVIGLVPTIRAIEAGKQIALASKEVLVAAGELVMKLVQRHGVQIRPIDSEHSAIFQCLVGSPHQTIDRLIITASGGPFRGRTRESLRDVTVEQALNHPTWRMGGKITIDSATLMNKGLEMIEAHWLFGSPMDNIDVVVHPQSIVHSLVKFTDGSVLAQMGWPNMRLPIQLALMYPERPESGLKPWDPTLTPSLTFEPPDLATFPAPNLAREAARIGGTMPCVLNAANERAVGLFLEGKIHFLQIAELVEQVMSSHNPVTANLEQILAFDAEAREVTRRLSRIDD